MKRIITCVAVILAIFAVNSVSAQPPGQMDPAARKAAMKQKLMDDLKFTDVQADSVANISQEYGPKMREIYMDQSLSQDDKKTKLAPINEERNKRLQAVLGDDNYKKYKDWEDKMRQQRMGGGRPNQ